MRAAPALLLLASACWVPVEQGKRMEARLDRIEQENELASQQFEEQRAAVRERVAKVDQKIAEVQKKLDELNAVSHRTGADLAVNQDKLTEQVRKLQGDLEADRHRLDLLDQSIASQRTDLEGKFAALKGAGALEDYEAKKKAAALKRPADKPAFFALAQSQEQAGEPGVARELYQEYVRKWPTDPRSADAWFRLGELNFGEKRYREAVLAYGKVAQDFPRSDKAPDALFRTAESMVALDLKDDAKGIYEDVVARYPKSDAAKRARARLAELAPPKKRSSKPLPPRKATP